MKHKKQSLVLPSHSKAAIRSKSCKFQLYISESHAYVRDLLKKIKYR